MSNDNYTDRIERCIRRVACKRCGRDPTAQSGGSLGPSDTCIVCTSWRAQKNAQARERLIERLRCINKGTWHDPDETGSDGRQTTLTEQA